MSRAAPESFIPFDPVGSTPSPPPSGPNLKVMPKAEGKAEFTPVEPPPNLTVHHTHAASAPSVTLQREGDRVTGIRIECQCGQVIELACGY